MASTIDSGIDTGNDSSESSFQEKMPRRKLDLEPLHTTAPDPNSLIIISNNADQTYPVPIFRPCATLLSQIWNSEPRTSTNLLASSARTPVSEYFAKCGMPNIISSNKLPVEKYGTRDRVARKLYYNRRAVRCQSYLQIYLRNKLCEKLFRAVSHNNTEKAKEILLEISPNCYDCSARTPLHMAACMGFTDMVKLLLDNGANPNAKDSKGNTPLHLAACTNHVRVISLLIQAGTRLSEKDLAGHSPLQLAITKLNIIKRTIKPNLALQEQIAQVVQMMKDYMKQEEPVEPELLSQLFSVMQVRDSSEAVESDIQTLLSNLSLSNKS